MKEALYLYNAKILTGSSEVFSGSIQTKNSKIIAVEEGSFNTSQNHQGINLKNNYILPGFIDTHIHGFGGYSTDDASTESILKMSELLPFYGVTSFIPTINAAQEDILLKRIEAIVNAIGKEKGAHILGIHLEGPFLSPDKNGGQEKSGLSPVSLRYLDKIIKTGNGHILNMTIAPELENMSALIKKCQKHHILLQAGHTNATYDQTIKAAALGVCHITHMFNAMRPLNHREPGTVGAVLTSPQISCEIIGDGVHVHPNLVRFLTQSKTDDKLVLVTDSLKYTKTKLPSQSPLYFKGCFKRKSDNTLMGSGITMLDGFQNILKFGIPLKTAVKMSSHNPAHILHLRNRGDLKIGYHADLIVLDKHFNLKATILNGKFYKNL